MWAEGPRRGGQIPYKAIERVRWNSFAGAGIGIFPELESDPTESEKAISRGGPGGSEHGQNPMAMQPPNGAARRRRSFDDSTMGTLEAVNYIIHALRDLPGRKAVILFSDGITIFGPGGNSRVMEQMQRLTDLANRAAVVIYTVDARGLQTLSITAAHHAAMGGAARCRYSLGRVIVECPTRSRAFPFPRAMSSYWRDWFRLSPRAI